MKFDLDYARSVIGAEADGVRAMTEIVDDTFAKAAEMIIAHIEAKRDALGINKKTERKLYDMDDRRALAVE